MGRQHRHERKPHKNHHKSQKSEKFPISPARPHHESKKHKKSQVHSPVARSPVPVTLESGQMDTIISQVVRAMKIRDKERPVDTPAIPPAPANTLAPSRIDRRENRVSIADVFKKSRPAAESRKAKKALPDPEMVIDVQDGLEVAYRAVDSNSKASFGGVYNGFMKQLEVAHDKDVAFLETITEATETLQASLITEDIEIETIRNGKRVKEIVSIGDRVSRFTSFVKVENATLQDLWHQWAVVQDEYSRLGEEVFGNLEMGTDTQGLGNSMGYNGEMGKFNSEYASAIDQIKTEASSIHERSLKKMRVSEKDLDLQAKRDQEALLRSLLFV